MDDARALLHEAGAALDRVPEASSPFFTTLTVSWVVDDRGPVPLPVAEDTMLLGRLVGATQARGHLAVASALTERLGGRTDLALALLDDAIARFNAVGDTFGKGYTLGQRGHTLRWAGDMAAALASFDAAEQVHRSLRDLRSIAMALAGRSYVAALLGQPNIARRHVQEAVSMMERSGDIAGVAHTLEHPRADRAGTGRRRRRPATAGAEPAPGRPAGSRRCTPSAGSTCSSPISAAPSAKPTRRFALRPRRRRGSGHSAIGEASEPCKERAKRASSRCRPDNDEAQRPVRPFQPVPLQPERSTVGDELTSVTGNRPAAGARQLTSGRSTS